MFLNDVLLHLHPQAERSCAELQARLDRLVRLYRQVSPSLPRPPAPIRALPAVVVEDLYRLFAPTSPDNPFRTSAIRWANQGKKSVTAHDLRHTCAVYRLSRHLTRGDDLDTAIDKLRVFLRVVRDISDATILCSRIL
jgi:integrase